MLQADRWPANCVRMCLCTWYVHGCVHLDHWHGRPCTVMCQRLTQPRLHTKCVKCANTRPTYVVSYTPIHPAACACRISLSCSVSATFSGLVNFFNVMGWRHLCLSNKRVISTSSNGYIVSAFHTLILVLIPRSVSHIQCCTEYNATLKHLVAIWRNFACKCASAFCGKRQWRGVYTKFESLESIPRFVQVFAYSQVYENRLSRLQGVD